MPSSFQSYQAYLPVSYASCSAARSLLREFERAGFESGQTEEGGLEFKVEDENNFERWFCSDVKFRSKNSQRRARKAMAVLVRKNRISLTLTGQWSPGDCFDRNLDIKDWRKELSFLTSPQIGKWIGSGNVPPDTHFQNGYQADWYERKRLYQKIPRLVLMEVMLSRISGLLYPPEESIDD